MFQLQQLIYTLNFVLRLIQRDLNGFVMTSQVETKGCQGKVRFVLFVVTPSVSVRPPGERLPMDACTVARFRGYYQEDVLIINRGRAPDVHRQRHCTHAVNFVKLQAWMCMYELAYQATEAELKSTRLMMLAHSIWFTELVM